MDTLGPRIMVNVGTQAVTHTGPNPRNLAPLTNDAFLATFMGKPIPLSSNGISRPQNNYRQSSYGTVRSKPRPSTMNGSESIEPDSAILSIIRGNGSDNNNNQQQTFQRQLKGNNWNYRSFNQHKYISGWNDIPCSPNYRPANELNRGRRTRSGGVQQQITVVDQMAAQPHIPYAILPKRFEPKHVSTNNILQQTRSSNNNLHYRHHQPAVSRRPQRHQTYYDDQWEDVEDDHGWSELNNRRRFNQRTYRTFTQASTYRGPRQHFNNYYNSYGPMTRRHQISTHSYRYGTQQNNRFISFKIVPSYDLNEWQGPYAQSQNSIQLQRRRNGLRRGRDGYNLIRDDHRMNNSLKQSRNNNKSITPTRPHKKTKITKIKGQRKHHSSQSHKQRSRNSKSKETTTTSTDEVKSQSETETTQEDKLKEEITTVAEVEEKPLPPRDNGNKEITIEQTTA